MAVYCRCVDALTSDVTTQWVALTQREVLLDQDTSILGLLFTSSMIIVRSIRRDYMDCCAIYNL